MRYPEQAGKGFSGHRTAYPELRAVVGANVPDLRGLFLRGTGGNAAALGTVQEDAGRNITGSFSSDALFIGALSTGNNPTGCFYAMDNQNRHLRADNDPGGQIIVMDASRSWGSTHTAGEFRPRNRAVRYLIRAAS